MKRENEQQHKCDAFYSTMKQCGKPATHYLNCYDGESREYFCDHHAELRKRQGCSRPILPLGRTG